MENKTYQNKKLSYPKLFQETIDNLGLISKEQLKELANTLIAREFPYFKLDEEIMIHSIENYIAHQSGIINIEELVGDEKDFLYTNGYNKPKYEIIPCLWALFSYFPKNMVNSKNIKRGVNSEVITYADKTTEYVFYYITEDNLATMRETIRHSKYLKSTTETRVTGEKEYKMVNVYVTDRVFVADEIEKFEIPYEYTIAVLKTGDLRFSKPEQIIFMKDGKRIK